MNRRDAMKSIGLSALVATRPIRLLAQNEEKDLIIYGATPGGLAAARAATRAGLTVAVVEPTTSIGGMISGGIAIADTPTPHFVGGLSREFFEAAFAESQKNISYEQPPVMAFGSRMIPWKTFQRWDIEPKSATSIFDRWVREDRYPLQRNKRVVSVDKRGTKIIAVRLSDGSRLRGKMFIDASYEGDLMALASVSSAHGRESTSAYQERFAGVQRPLFQGSYSPEFYAVPGPEYMHLGQFGVDIPARRPDGTLLSGVTPRSTEKNGGEDHELQAFCYRVIATQRKDLMVPWPKPRSYSSDRYAVLLNYIQAHPGMSFARLVHFQPIPNGKWDLNASGPFSVDYIGGNHGFVEANYQGRDAMLQAHLDYQQGFFWFLAHDERVDKSLRDEVNSWGLAKDEFPATGNWPVQLYIREARRMVGAYVMTERDVLTETVKPDTVGLGSYALDSHWVRRFENEDGFIRVEGNLDETIDLSCHPYQITYRSLTPKPQECTNLLVPVCISASHVAICTLRMEPVYMILGHAAGVAAAIALRAGCEVQQVDMQSLQSALTKQGQILTKENAAPALPQRSDPPRIVRSKMDPPLRMATNRS